MQHFSSDGAGIAYIDAAPGTALPGHPAVLLIHGFASNAATNWVQTGWVRTLTDAGYRVLAFDNRGHGESAKLYGLEDYGAPLMAEDARRLLDHVGLKAAHVMGYSMGARISAFLLLNHPGRVLSATFGGLGINMVRGMTGRGDTIAEALEAPNLDAVTDPGGRAFRAFAEQTQSDLRALAACMRSARVPITAEALAQVRVPVLVAVGTEDVIAGSAAELAQVIPGARYLDIPGRDHMKALGDRVFKAAVIEFLATQAGWDPSRLRPNPVEKGSPGRPLPCPVSQRMLKIGNANALPRLYHAKHVNAGHDTLRNATRGTLRSEAFCFYAKLQGRSYERVPGFPALIEP